MRRIPLPLPRPDLSAPTLHLRNNMTLHKTHKQTTHNQPPNPQQTTNINKAPGSCVTVRGRRVMLNATPGPLNGGRSDGSCLRHERMAIAMVGQKRSKDSAPKRHKTAGATATYVGPLVRGDQRSGRRGRLRLGWQAFFGLFQVEAPRSARCRTLFGQASLLQPTLYFLVASSETPVRFV